MRHWIAVSVLVLPFVAIASQAAQDAIVLENHPRAYAYSYGFGDEEGTGAYLGVDISDIRPERMAALKLKEEQGVEITMVDQDAPAGKAGLKEHDVILTMNGTAIESGAQLRRMIHETPPGRVITLGLSRDGRPLTIKVQLGDRGKNMAFASNSKDFKFEMPAIPPMPDFDVPVSVVVVHSSLRSGLMVENITPQLGEFFGVKNGHGVLVRSVEKGSSADKAGFRAGDVIVRVNDQPVHDTSDFSHALRSRSGGQTAVVVIRDKREQNLTLPLPDRGDSGGIFEESFDSPELDADAGIDLATLNTEMARLQPQIRVAVAAAQEEVERARPEIEKAQRIAQEEIAKHRGEIDRAVAQSRAAAEQMRKDLFAQQRQMQEEMRKAQREMRQQLEQKHRRLMEQNRRQMERMRHELSGDWLEI
jgi:serine protease Do